MCCRIFYYDDDEDVRWQHRYFTFTCRSKPIFFFLSCTVALWHYLINIVALHYPFYHWRPFFRSHVVSSGATKGFTLFFSYMQYYSPRTANILQCVKLVKLLKQPKLEHYNPAGLPRAFNTLCIYMLHGA